MSSPCVQSFPDPLAHDSQNNVLRFVNPNSLSHQSSPTFHSSTSCSTSTSTSTAASAAASAASNNSSSSTSSSSYDFSSYIPAMKPREVEDPHRRFSYADLLSGQTTNHTYDNDSCYMAMSSSSPSNDSDDYQRSSRSDTSVSTTQQDQMSFIDPSTAAVAAAAAAAAAASVQSSFDVHQHQHQHPHQHHLPPNVSECTTTHPTSTLPMPTMTSSAGPMFSSMHPFAMTPLSLMDPHQQHRHSIAAPASHHLGSSFYDSSAHRHHSFSHPSGGGGGGGAGPLFDPNHSTPRPAASPATSMIQSFANLCTSRPVTPVSSLMSLSPNGLSGIPKDENQDMMNDLCFSSVFSMSGLNDGRRRTLPSLSEKSTNDPKSKAPRSRGRRVSNVPSNGARMFTCKAEGCGKVFKRSEHLKRHIRSIHTLEKPFECPYQSCNKRFSRSDNLNQHIRIHRHSNNSVNKDTKPSTHAAENPHFTSFVQNYL